MNPVELKAYRKKHGMTQQELASKLGVSKTIICYYERGTQVIAARHKKKLKTLFEANSTKNL